MCGLAGFIGESKDKNLSFDIATSLFSFSQTRGIDACGFYACDYDDVFYHKQKGKADNLIKSNTWQDLRDKDLNLILMHTRKTSFNSGSSENNINNHPFVINNSALIHNGVVHDYNEINEFINTISNCDSEILLNYVSDFTENYFNDRLKKIRDYGYTPTIKTFLFLERMKKNVNLIQIVDDKPFLQDEQLKRMQNIIDKLQEKMDLLEKK